MDIVFVFLVFNNYWGEFAGEAEFNNGFGDVVDGVEEEFGVKGDFAIIIYVGGDIGAIFA